MDEVLQYFDRDAFAKHAGIELIEFGPGWAKCKMKITDAHLNGLGRVHGGAIFTLADFAFAVASNSHGTVAVAIQAGISFVKAAGMTTLFVDVREESLNPKLGSYSGRVTDEAGDTVALFSGMVYRKKELITEVKW
jgi:acyl-CoA thioesterase